MARRLKIVQAASDEPLSSGSEITSVNGYGWFLKTHLAPHHSKMARRLGYDYEWTDKMVVHPFWMKAYMILAALEAGFDRIVWLDADAVWLGEPLEPEFDTVFGLTYHEGFGAYEHHFNAGVIYVNNEGGRALEVVNSWFLARHHTFNDQAVLNQRFRDEITHLDHCWNASAWIEHYASAEPRVLAWHGCPDRITHMLAYLKQLNS